METQDAAARLLFRLWPQIEANKNKIIGTAAIIAVVALLILFYSLQHERTQVASGEAMTQALVGLQPGTTPAQAADTYLAVSRQYSGTPAGDRALLQAAAIMFTEGKYSDAQSYFQQYLDAKPDGEFSGQAALGVGKCYEAQGKLNEAAGEYQRVINDLPDPVAILSAKFSLALIDAQQKNFSGAQSLFEDVVQTDPRGELGDEAGQFLYDLQTKRSLPAAAPTTAPAAPFSLTH
jgi:TolA-binding protein